MFSCFLVDADFVSLVAVRLLELGRGFWSAASSVSKDANSTSHTKKITGDLLIYLMEWVDLKISSMPVSCQCKECSPTG